MLTVFMFDPPISAIARSAHGARSSQGSPDRRRRRVRRALVLDGEHGVIGWKFTGNPAPPRVAPK
jgi:hypothetical protein